VIFSYLNPSNLADKYNAAKDYTENLTDPFPELERIARNRPKDNIPKEYPKTTDGTTASIVRKTGKRVVQQLPTGKVESDDDHSWLNVIAEFVYTHKILPYANEEYDLIQKCWQLIERGLVYGSSAIFTPFLNHDGHFSTDMTLPYWGDIFLPKGAKSGYTAKYMFVRSWWQKEDFEALIDQEKKLKKQAKERGEEYEATWDIDALEEIKTKTTRKDEKAVTASEDELGVNPDGIEVVVAYQDGVGAKFYTFHPSEDKNGETDVSILRTKVNKDPRGKKPIDWFYADIDGSNPLGRSIVDLIKGLQNLIDADMQMYQYNRALMLAPPTVTYGNVPAKSVIYKPNAIIKIKDPNGRIDNLKVDSTAIANYPELYGLQKSQLLNLVSSPDTSISAEVGNPGFSKTSTGVKQQAANVSIDDNFLRKMFEAAWENWSETAINLYFAERTGKEVLQLDKKTADSLRKLASEGKFDEAALNEKNEIIIDYDESTPALKFRVDASTSKMKTDSEQGEILTNLLQGIDGSPTLGAILQQYPEKGLEMWNKLIDTAGLEDSEELKFDIEEFKQQQQMMQEQQVAQEQAMAEEQAMMQGQMPQEAIEGEIVPEMPMEQAPQEGEMLGQIFESFIDQGIPEDIAVEAVGLAAEGVPMQEVLARIEEAVNARG
jgi:hypothetical protein